MYTSISRGTICMAAILLKKKKNQQAKKREFKERLLMGYKIG